MNNENPIGEHPGSANELIDKAVASIASTPATSETIGSRALGNAALATLHRFSRGILLLNLSGHVLFANWAALQMLRCKDGLAIVDGRLASLCPRAGATLERYFTTAPSSRLGSLVLRVDRERAVGSYRLLVSPLSDRAELDVNQTAYCVFVYEPDSGRCPLPLEVLRQLYGLTASEARLANELFVGRTLRQAAESHGVSINTVRFTLKNIFRKCEVNSQAELLQLLSLGPRSL